MLEQQVAGGIAEGIAVGEEDPVPQSLRQEGGPHATLAPSQDNGVFHTIII